MCEEVKSDLKYILLKLKNEKNIKLIFDKLKLYENIPEENIIKYIRDEKDKRDKLYSDNYLFPTFRFTRWVRYKEEELKTPNTKIYPSKYEVSYLDKDFIMIIKFNNPVVDIETASINNNGEYCHTIMSYHFNRVSYNKTDYINICIDFVDIIDNSFFEILKKIKLRVSDGVIVILYNQLLLDSDDNKLFFKDVHFINLNDLY